MRRPARIVAPGAGARVGGIEFLARSEDTPYFNLGIVTLLPGEEVPAHTHVDEDDSMLVLDGVLTVTLDGELVDATAGTFVLVPSGTEHSLANASDRPVRFFNVHAPGGFDRRVGLP